MILRVRYDEAAARAMSDIYDTPGIVQAMFKEIQDITVTYSVEPFGKWYHCTVYPNSVTLLDNDDNPVKILVYGQKPTKKSVSFNIGFSLFEGSKVECTCMGKTFRYNVPDGNHRNAAEVIAMGNDLQLLLGMEE